MSGETVITICGNLVDDPQLSYTPSGAAVAKFRVASTPRVFDKQSNEWKDGEGLFLTCSVWRQPAEHVAESLTRGMRVIVQGQLKQRSYEKDGQKHTVYELDVHEVGPSLKSATAKVTKVKGGQGQGQQAYQQARQQQGAASVEDPWAQSTPGAQPAGGGWGQQGQGGGQGGYSGDSEPPF
ncbi:single-stranded DNA-binding protein [Streptomyces sp. NPDC048511]|uniref:single-stranded DNA-binding protein n=1 Tax=Streptomyces sp. NPDC048511 TaxID=3365562 RepID=UPI00371DB7F1